MNRFRDTNPQDKKKPLPVSKGININMFDLSISVVRRKLLKDTEQGDGYPVSIDQPGFEKKANSRIGSQVTSKPMECGGRRLGETPMKMLIAQEMATAIKSKETPPSVVAKLMGLDTFPDQPKAQTCKRYLQETHLHNCPNSALQDYRRQEEGSYNQMQYRSELCIPEKYKDVYDVKQHISTNGQIENQNSQHGDCHDNLMEKRASLVHQKFIEAKRLATNERLLHSKEFKDAVEVLNSNRDLFVKLLEEPNSMFSKQLEELQKIISLGAQTKHITVLKPTTSFATDHEKSTKKTQYTCENMRDIDVQDWSSSLFLPKDDVVSQLTRIVVLKPSPSMPREAQSNLASHISLPFPKSGYESGNSRIDEETGVREVSKKINQLMQKKLRSAQKDVYPTTSGYSNGYVADQSSVNRSENGYKEEGGSDCSNSELVTPTSLNSWVRMRSCSPGSLSSFSHESNSAVSSVSKEAKKRLSERLLLVILNANSCEQPDFRKCYSTLGEMLSVPVVKKEEEMVDRLSISPSDSHGQEQDMSMTGICSSSGRMQESSEFSPENFTRLMSFPTSACYENMKVNEETSCKLSSNAIHLKELPKNKDGKSTFKEKVWGVFFSRRKKLLRDKTNLSTSLNSDDRLHVNDSNLSKSFHDGISDETASKTLEDKIVKFTSPLISTSGGERIGNISLKGIRSIGKLWKPDSRENSKQPSPISVLERPFQEDFVGSISHSSQCAISGHPKALSRSPHIGPVSRSSYWENAHFESVSPNSLKLFKLFSKEDEEEEQFDFIQNLLASSNLANEKSTAILAKSHSLDSPLDPALLDELLDIKVEEAKCRERRLNHRLLFDCVNVSLRDIGHCALLNAYPWSTTSVRARKSVKTNSTVADAVWCLVKDCFSEEEICGSSKSENNRQIVDYFVKKEVSGNGLVESMWLEMDEFSKEIGEKMLEELFDDALSDLTG